MKLTGSTLVGDTHVLNEFRDLWDYVKRIEVGADDALGELLLEIKEDLEGKQDLLGYIAENIENKGVANGYAPLDVGGLVPYEHLPSLDYIPLNDKGVAGGVATLNAGGKLVASQVPSSLRAMKIVANIEERDRLEVGNKESCDFVVANLGERDDLVLDGIISVGQKVHVIDATVDMVVDSGWAEYLYGNGGFTLLSKYETFEGLRVHVIDASLDETVDSGWAEYLYFISMEDIGEWTKVAEKESLDITLDYDNLEGSPWLVNKAGDLYYVGDGNVGIGTNDPKEKLDIAHAIRIYSDNAPARLTLYGDTSNFGDSGIVDSQIEFLHDNGNMGYLMQVYNNAEDSDFELVEKSYDVLRGRLFLSGGNGSLGVGVTDAKNRMLHEKLYVQLDNSEQYVYIKNTDSTSNNLPVFKIDGRVGSSQSHMIVTRAGNVGIGVNTPSQMLDIAGNVKIGTTLLSGEGNAFEISNVFGSINFDFNNDVVSLSTDKSLFSFNRDIVSLTGKYISASGIDLQLGVGGSTSITIDKDNGNVGVGKGEASEVLDVEGNVKGKGFIIHNASSNVDSSRGVLFDGDGSSNFFINHMTNLSMSDYRKNYVEFGSDEEISYGFMGGNVGIGTNDPKVMLDVRGDIALNTYKLLFDSVGSIGFIGVNNIAELVTNGAMHLTLEGSNSEGFMISNTDNQSLLELTGDGSKAYFRANKIGFGTGDIVGNLDLGTGSGSKLAFGSLSTDKTHRAIELFYEDRGWLDSTLHFREYGQSGIFKSDLLTMKSGRVGIGSSVPLGRLHVSNIDMVGRVDKYATTLIDDSTSRLQLRSNGNSNTGSALLLSNLEKSWVLRTELSSNQDSFYLGFRDSTGQEEGEDIVLNMSKLLTVKKTGEVGIGTVNPNYMLDVLGNSRIDGELNISNNLILNNITDTNIGATIQFSKSRGEGKYLLEGDSLLKLVGNTTSKTLTEIESSVESVTNGKVSSRLDLSTSDSNGVLNKNFTLLGNGNVGVGDNNPNERLSVRGDIKFGHDLDSYIKSSSRGTKIFGKRSSLILGVDESLDTQIELNYEANIIGNRAGILKIGQISKENEMFTHGTTSFYTNGVEQMTLNHAGFLGIGGQDSLHKLYVKGMTFLDGKVGINTQSNRDFGLSVLGGAIIDTQMNTKQFVVSRVGHVLESLSMGVDTDNTILQSNHIGTSSKILFNINNRDIEYELNTNSGTVLSLTQSISGGRVGINKTDAISALDVVGDIRLTGDITLPDSRRVINLLTDSGGAVRLRAGGAYIGSIYGDIAEGSLYVQNSVGIGKVPNRALDVKGDIALTGKLFNDLYFGFYTLGGSAQIIKSGGLVVSDSYTDNVSRNDAFIKGKVKIGTTTATETLSVGGNISLTDKVLFVNGVSLDNTLANSLAIKIDNLGYVLDNTKISNTSTNNFRLESNKRIILDGGEGFGTDNLYVTDNKLWLRGASALNDFTIQIGDSASHRGSFKLLSSLGSRIFEVDNDGTLFSTNIGDTGNLATTDKTLVGAINELDREKYDKTGGLISGDVQISGGSVTTLKSNRGLWLINDISSSAKVLLGTAHNNDLSMSMTYRPNTVGIGEGIFILGQEYKNHANFTHGITAFHTNGTEKMRITKEGHVGIGTSNPIYKLEVVGDIKSSGLLIEKAVEFTPSLVGWYRVLIKEGYQGGIVRIYNNFNNKKSDIELQYSVGSYGLGGSIQQLRHASYGDNTITKVRVLEEYEEGVDNTTSTYLDIYVADITHADKITVHVYGKMSGDIIEDVIVGATLSAHSRVYELELGEGIRTTSDFIGAQGTFLGDMEIFGNIDLARNLNLSTTSRINVGAENTYLAYDLGKIRSSSSFRADGHMYLTLDGSAIYFGSGSDINLSRVSNTRLKVSKGLEIGTDLIVLNDSTVTRNLSVGGCAYVIGDVDAQNLISRGNLAITGDGTLSKSLSVGTSLNVGDVLTVVGNGSIGADMTIGRGLEVGTSLLVGTDFDVLGNGDITGSLAVGTTLLIGTDLTVTRNTYLRGILNVAGNVSLSSDFLVANNTILSKSLDVGTDLSVGGSGVVGTTLEVGTDLIVTGSSYVKTDLEVSGGANVLGDLLVGTNIDIEGSALIGTTLGVGTNLVVGSESNLKGDVTINAGLSVDMDISTSNNIIVGKALSVGTNLSVLGDGTIAQTLDVGEGMTIGTTLEVGTNLVVLGASSTNTTMTVGTNLFVRGDTLLTGNLFVDTALSVGGAVTFDRLLSVGTDLEVLGDGNILGGLSVTGAGIFDSTLSVGTNLVVTNNATISNDLVVNNTTRLAKTLLVGTDLTVNNNTTLLKALSVGTNLNVLGSTTLVGLLGVAGNATFDGTMRVGTTLLVGTDLTVNNNTSILKSLTVGENAHVSGNLTLDGNVDVDLNLTVLVDGVIGNNLDVGNDLEVTGNTILNKRLDVKSNALILGNLGVNTNLNVLGDSTLSKALSVGTDLTVLNNATISKALGVGTDLNVVNAITTKTLSTTQTLSVGTNLNVVGDSVLSKSLKVGTDIQVSGKLLVGTTSSSSLLHVRKEVATDTFNDIYAVGSIEAEESRLQLKSTNSGRYGSAMILTTGTHNWTVRADAVGKKNSFCIGYHLATSNTDMAYTGTDFLTITTTGRIGVKNDNPSYDLDVAGEINGRNVMINGEQVSVISHKHRASRIRKVLVVGDAGISKGTLIELPDNMRCDFELQELRVHRDSIEQLIDTDSTSLDFDYWQVDDTHIRFNYNLPSESVIRFELIDIVAYSA